MNNQVQGLITEAANRMTNQYNVYRDTKLGNEPLSFTAEYHRKDEKYFLTKKVRVYEVQNQHFLFVKELEHITAKDIKRMTESMLTHMKSFIPNQGEHMSTMFAGVLVTEGEVANEAKKMARRFRKIKFLNYGKDGWADLYIAIVQVKEKEIYIHKKGRELVYVFDTLL
ncbi:hypothetical protein ACFPU1_16490 [Thalassorhabdus alkalitolerans]|uniref:DUF8052 domain-containing protein n=1 Tax=Thalassorhabdus alkalitolerans TaxID=2282697 RepID=A0ABW0YSK2_9BACI